MNKMVAGLVALIVVLVGALMYLAGQNNLLQRSPEPEASEAASPSAEDAAKAKQQADEEAARKAASEQAAAARPVRIGVDGPTAFACRAVGRIANLPPGRDNFLSVRAGPTSKAKELDKLGTDDLVVLCDQNGDGSWIGVVYESAGRLEPLKSCGVVEPVASTRPYKGQCLSGWVYAKYVEVTD